MRHPDARSRPDDESRRSFIRKLAYSTPVLLTLPAAPALAQVGSQGSGCIPSVFNGFCAPPPPTDQYGCVIGSEFPIFGPNGAFLGCGS